MRATTRRPPVGMGDKVAFLEAGPAGTGLHPADQRYLQQSVVQRKRETDRRSPLLQPSGTQNTDRSHQRSNQLDNSFPLLRTHLFQGYRLPFMKVPPDTSIRPTPIKFSQQERTAITGEVHSLLDKKVIHLADSQGGFVSNTFMVPKGSEQVRLIHNLKSLNTFLEYEHFKMEDIRCVKDLLSRNDFMCIS